MNNIIAIKKDHEVIKIVKSLINHNKPNDLFLIEDLFSLGLFIKGLVNVKKVKYFIYCNELEYSIESRNVIDYMVNNVDNIYTVSKKTMDSLMLKENFAGLIAICEVDVKDINNLDSDMVLILDRLENPGNIGTLIRTMQCCGYKDIILCDPIVKINNTKLIQSSRGTVLIQNMYQDSFDNVVNTLLNKGYNIYLGEPELGKDYKSYKYEGKTAIVVGHERFGINKRWYDFPHHKVFIPQSGIVSSLNVSVAGSILVYEVYMQKVYRNEQ